MEVKFYNIGPRAQFPLAVVVDHLDLLQRKAFRFRHEYGRINAGQKGHSRKNGKEAVNADGVDDGRGRLGHDEAGTK